MLKRLVQVLGLVLLTSCASTLENLKAKRLVWDGSFIFQSYSAEGPKVALLLPEKQGTRSICLLSKPHELKDGTLIFPIPVNFTKRKAAIHINQGKNKASVVSGKNNTTVTAAELIGIATIFLGEKYLIHGAVYKVTSSGLY